MPDFELERAAGGIVAGVDEAGRGPWAGPVVAAAAILDISALEDDLRAGLDDSKKLSRRKRQTLFEILQNSRAVRSSVGRAEVDEIDRLNILRASLLAMSRAVGGLNGAPDSVLVDGLHAPDIPHPVQCVVKGDSKSLSIAAASIVAKVWRDHAMAELDLAYPGYGWARNAGYGTAEHQAALKRLGVTPHHRRSFKPIIKILGDGAG